MKTAFVDRTKRYALWPVAMINVTADQIRVAGFEVGRDIDDLDELSFADLTDETTGPIFLNRHDQAPYRAFNVEASAEFTRRDVIRRLEQALHCREEDYEWITPYAAFPGYIADEVDPDLIARASDGTPLENMPWSRRFEEPRGRIARPA